MNYTRFLSTAIALALLLPLSSFSGHAQEPAGVDAPQGFGFTYQGELKHAGDPVDGICSLKFILYDSSAGGTQVGPALTRPDVWVGEGLFTINDLDFGEGAFDGQVRWLEIAVRCQGDSSYITLSPRQELTAAPYAAYALNSGGLNGHVAGDFASAIHNHWGQSWSGGGTGLSLFGGSTGLHSSGTELGVYGRSPSATGKGVYGEATSTTGWNTGVYGHSASVNGTGVEGRATATSGANWGVVGVTESTTDGRGVYGSAPASSGYNYGVFGQAASTSGTGVMGWAYADSGETAGVQGRSDSPSGRGVSGANTAATGEAYGVYGRSHSNAGFGVSGRSDGFFGVYAWGDDSSAYDTKGDLLLAGTYGEIFTYGELLDIYSNAHVIIDLDDDNNTANAFFRILGGTDDILWTVSETLGVVASGRQASTVSTADYGERLLYSIEGTRVWVEEIGSAELVGGSAVIRFDPIFAQTVNLETPYQVFVTPISQEPVWLYVASKTADGFEVRGVTIDNKPADCGFDYRVVAQRSGYEEARTELFTAKGKEY